MDFLGRRFDNPADDVLRPVIATKRTGHRIGPLKPLRTTWLGILGATHVCAATERVGDLVVLVPDRMVGDGPLAIVHALNLAAILAVVLLAGIGVFQIALALGAPLGYAAWGGRHGGVLPARLRIASGVVGVVVYPLIGLFVLASAGLINADWMPGTGKTGMWILAGLFTLGGLANFASRSKVERYWGPVSVVIAVCCGITATRI